MVQEIPQAAASEPPVMVARISPNFTIGLVMSGAPSEFLPLTRSLAMLGLVGLGLRCALSTASWTHWWG